MLYKINVKISFYLKAYEVLATVSEVYKYTMLSLS